MSVTPQSETTRETLIEMSRTFARDICRLCDLLKGWPWMSLLDRSLGSTLARLGAQGLWFVPLSSRERGAELYDLGP